MIINKLVLSAALAVAIPSASIAQTITIRITNLTQGQHFTSRLVVAHNDTVDLFQAGVDAANTAATPPSPRNGTNTAPRALAWLAEAGVRNNADNTNSTGSNFESLLGPALTNNGSNRWQGFGELLAPATTSGNYTFDTGGFPRLSVLAMLVPTNDAFLGLDSITIPTTSGTHTFNVNAYDAGTELNDELNPAANDGANGSTRTVTEAGTGIALGGYAVPGMAAPAPTQASLQTNSTATGVAAQVDSSNQVADGTDGPVHIHRNTLGDTNSTAGASDLDSRVHRWLNPVARITIVIP